MKSIFRYGFPDWPPSFDGREFVSRFGTFDFERALVMVHLENEREEQQKLLHISASRRQTFAILEQTIAQIQAMPETAVAEWHHPSRDLPVEEKQQQNCLAAESDFVPEHLGDQYLGFGLQRLIYKKQFVRAMCPICERWFEPGECDLKRWMGDDWGGYRLSCPHDHTLLCDNSICVTSFP